MCFGYISALEFVENGDLFAISHCAPRPQNEIKYLTIRDYNTEVLKVI